jgi:hypothetical protein
MSALSTFSIGGTLGRPPVAPEPPPVASELPLNKAVPELAQPAHQQPERDRHEELISLSAISRKVDLNYVTLARLLRDAGITPDFTNHGTQLFRLSRLAQIREIVKR